MLEVKMPAERRGKPAGHKACLHAQQAAHKP
jgi:hypothetical protein